MVLTLTCSLISEAAEYKEGWTAENFYSEVLECKKSVVFPTASDYVKRGIERKHENKSLYNEVISMVPTFDMIASSSCFCALNEIAKDKAYAESKQNIDFQSYASIPRCKDALLKAMTEVKSNPDALKLK